MNLYNCMDKVSRICLYMDSFLGEYLVIMLFLFLFILLHLY